MEISPFLILVILLVLAAEFVNGWTDAPNAIATVVSTRVISPYKAVIMATILNFAGTLAGIEVATTIGKGIVKVEAVTLITIAAAMIGIIIWSSLAAKYGLPTSESHALIAGLAGAALANAGPGVLLLAGWKKVLIGLGFSTFLGFFGGVFLMSIIYSIFYKVHRMKVNIYTKTLQVFSSAFMAFSHGTNDGQKFMGVFALALVISGVLPEFAIPLWVKLICALIMGLGTAFGGFRIIRTMGIRMTRLQPAQGFAAEMAAATTIEAASRLGIPLSTTHTINTAIMGASATKRLSAVRWSVALQIVKAWVLTFPVCAGIAYFFTKVLNFFF